MLSNFFFHLASILGRYSGLISIAAYVNAESLSPDLWHSMTVDVNIGTISISTLSQSPQPIGDSRLGNLLMLPATLTNKRAALS